MPNRNNGQSLFERAHSAWDRGRVNDAFLLFRFAAENGDESCQINLGYFYDEGIGTRKNKTKAMYWYLKAYRRGESAAATNIGILYREKKKNALAVQWFRRAIALKDDDALYELGNHYRLGLGVRKSRGSAVQCYKRILNSKNVTEFTKEQAIQALNELDTKPSLPLDVGAGAPPPVKRTVMRKKR